MTEAWTGLWPWFLGALVVFVTIVALWRTMRKPHQETADDLYSRAIDRWVDGDLLSARKYLRQVVEQQPHRSEPYLQLGILMRLTGDPGRAAAMHRGLTTRRDLSPGRMITIGLELSEDLLDLKRFDEADEVLQHLQLAAGNWPRWYRLRFATALGQGNDLAALSVLREGEKRLKGDKGQVLRKLRAAWLVDEAYAAVRRDDIARAQELLGKAKGLKEAEGRVLLIRTLVAMANQNSDQAVKAVSEGLSKHPNDMIPALGLLEGALMDTGKFSQVIPILESACQADDSAPALWMSLARIYEKLDRREDAIRLLSSRRGDPRLTPDAATPYLRLLTAERPDSAISRVWNLLSSPAMNEQFACQTCGRREGDIRWFCPDCHSADSFTAVIASCPGIVPATGDHQPVPTTPPRF